MTHQHANADVSCRVAWGDDADAIASVQLAAWRQRYGNTLPADVLSGLSVEQFAGQWHRALTMTKEARNRVLVALEQNTVRGYVVTGPASDPDLDPITAGELSDLTVADEHAHKGHGSRLLNAAVDTLRADKFERVVVWTNVGDDVTRAFYAEAGWEADGAHRTLDLTGDGSVQVKQVRLHCSV